MGYYNESNSGVRSANIFSPLGISYCLLHRVFIYNLSFLPQYELLEDTVIKESSRYRRDSVRGCMNMWAPKKPLLPATLSESSHRFMKIEYKAALQ